MRSSGSRSFSSAQDGVVKISATRAQKKESRASSPQPDIQWSSAVSSASWMWT
jgi:hypothetical protein